MILAKCSRVDCQHEAMVEEMNMGGVKMLKSTCCPACTHLTMLVARNQTKPTGFTRVKK